MQKSLDAQIAEVNGKLAEIDRRSKENISAASDTETRIEEAKRRGVELAADQEAARAARQNALAAGEDVKEISKRLRALGESRELCEDEAAGLSVRLEKLRAVGLRLRAERKAAAREIPMAKLRDAVRRRDPLARQLAPINAEIWALRRELGEPLEGRVVHTPRGLVGDLECIPRLFIPGLPDIVDVGDPEKHFFFDGPGMKEKRVQRVRPLLVDEDPGAAVAAEGGKS
jgi:hypothetical protein